MDTNTNLQERTSDSPENIRQSTTVIPLVDIAENSQEILLVADLPGVSTDNLSIRLDGNELSIETTRTSKQEGVLLFQGYEDLDFARTFKVPNTIDTSKIDADIKNGVLTIHLPKLESTQPRQISVKAG